MKSTKWVVAAASLVFLYGTASACSCEPISVAEGFARAEAVFSGKVISAERARWVFAVGSIWKGEVAERVVLRDALSLTSCASSFSLGERYVVFARWAKFKGGQIHLVK